MIRSQVTVICRKKLGVEKNGLWYTYFSLAPMTASFWVTYNLTGENLFLWEQEGKSVKKALDYLLRYQNLHLNGSGNEDRMLGRMPLGRTICWRLWRVYMGSLHMGNMLKIAALIFIRYTILHGFSRH